ncbi:MAG: hypothetical protein A2Z88_03345 [Omnitrophica WOR_2 bacterium GWA2_47_8]|nr:MAG: hypothetical protein A2Z88_03345 [Omnitrophica WOR_2 bacterium GWA2_47_8]
MNVKLLVFTFSLVLFFFVIDLTRREKLTFKYAAGWLGVSLLAILSIVFDKFLFKFSSWLGFALPSNFIFFGLMCTFIILALLLTVFLCQQDTRNRLMAQKIAVLEFELEQLKKEPKNPSVKENQR